MNLLIPTAFAATPTGAEPTFFERTVTIGTNVVIIVAILVVFLILARFVISRIIRAIRYAQANDGDEHLEIVMVTQRLTYLVFTFLAIAIGLGVTNMFGQLGWLFGAIGLGIGFAFQTIIGNFVAGITLLLQRKVKINDIVEIGGFRGIVTNIGGRAVTLHDFDGTEVLIPNLEFFNKYVRIYTANTFRRIQIDMSVGYDTDFALAYAKIFEILKRYPDVEAEPAPDVLCDRLDSSNVNLLVRWWIRSNLKWWTLQSNILRDIFVELQQIGVDISFPVTTLRVDNRESGLLADWARK